MARNWVNLLVFAYFSAISLGTPIKDGRDVGHLKMLDGQLVITGKTDFPYVVHIKIADKTSDSDCAGVIIGKNSVLTAGHCLYGTVEPRVTIHAGIIERNLEANRGQKLQMIDHKVHEKYKKSCQTGKSRCCHQVNDIAIVWTNKEFTTTQNVQRAILNANLEKPVGKEGWIVGWGMKSNNKMSSMLQKGLVKVVPQQECKRYNPKIYISQNMICLKGVNKDTKSSFGDSGGPFVIDGKVFGISSIGIPKSTCSTEALDGYTYVAKYFDWINENLKAGPPNLGKPKRSA